jgi:hypothetical protein
MDCKDHGKTKSLRPEGYALVGIPGKAGRCVNLHRLVYCQYNGVTLESIKGLCVRHTCDNTRCIEPTHLVIGSWAQNNADRAERGRSAKAVPARHKLGPAEVAAIGAMFLGGVRKTHLARQFGVDFNVIQKVLNGTYTCTRS